MTSLIWIILAVMSLVSLVIGWNKRSPVWGGFTLGVLVGLALTLLLLIIGRGFIWTLILKAAIVGSLAGYLSELLGKVSDFIGKKKGTHREL